jgi:tetratricopeptide (TPR) repeat protein
MPTIALQQNSIRQKIPALFFIAITFCTLSPPSKATPPNNPIADIANRITVHIDGKNHGSGVIIQHQGNTYTILSAAHVFNPQTHYTIVTIDGQRHPIIESSIKPLPKVDLATAQFNSSQTYSIAQLGNSSKVTRKDPCYISGYTATPNGARPTYHFRSGQIEANAPHPIDQGYALAYYPKTIPGMSGGPVLDNQGHLIGIQGLSLVPSVAARTINPLKDLTDRFNMAIPINTFVDLAATTHPTLKLTPVKSASATQSLTVDDLFIRGTLHYTQSDQRAALSDYSNVIRLAPDYAPAYYGRANLRAETGDVKGALTDYTQALQLSPNYTLAYYYRGGIYAEQGELEKAIADYNQALQRNPTLSVVYNNRGTVRYRLGDLKGAIADYDLALQKNPKLRDAYNNRGLARYGLGDLKGALKDYDRAIQLEPTRANLYKNRGFIYSASGNRQAAQLDLQKAADLYRSQADTDHYNEVLEQIRQMNQ